MRDHSPKAEFTPGIKSKIALVVFSILFSLILLEIGLRLVYPQKTYDRVQGISAGIFRESQWLIWELLPNFSGTETAVEQGLFIPYYVETNSHGFRDEEFPVEKPADTYRIMIMGDSFTFGMGVDNGQDYPAVLETCLNDRLYGGDTFQVINAGYASGFSPDSYYVFLREIAPPYDSDLVIAAYYVDNDIVDLYDTVWINEQDGLPEHLTSETRFVNLQGQLTYRDSLPRYKIPVLRNSHAFQLLMEAALNTDIEQIRGDVPEYARNPETFDLVYTPDLTPELGDLFDKSMRMLGAMQDLGESGNFDFMTFIIPEGEQVGQSWWDNAYTEYPESPEDAYPQKAIREYLDGQGIEYLDLLPRLWGQPDLYFNPASHWTAEGNAVAAGVLCDYLIQNHLRDEVLNQGDGVKAVIAENTVFIYADENKEVIAEIDSLEAQTITNGDWSVEVVPQGAGVGVVVSENGVVRDDKLVIYEDDGQLSFHPSEIPNSFDLSPEMFAAYQDYLETAEALEGIVFNPAERELAAAYVEQAQQIGQLDGVYDLFPLLRAFEVAVFEAELSSDQQTAVSEWRVSKQADDLSGITYLFTDTQWLQWLTPEESKTLNDPAQYELVDSWQVGENTFYLYKIVD
jgi:hypothetical protein